MHQSIPYFADPPCQLKAPLTINANLYILLTNYLLQLFYFLKCRSSGHYLKW